MESRVALNSQQFTVVPRSRPGWIWGWFGIEKCSWLLEAACPFALFDLLVVVCSKVSKAIWEEHP